MKHVVSVSLGSSERNKRSESEFLGEGVIVERIGTDGSIPKAIEIIKELDGKVDAFGMGGIDLWIQCGRRRYMFKDALPIARAATKTPIFDGSLLKGTLERRVIRYLYHTAKVPFGDLRVLVVSGADRFGMAEALSETGCQLTLGDLMFTIGIPVPLHSLEALDRVARIIAPIVVRLPFSMVYPVGEKQTKRHEDPKYGKYYTEADVVAGDFHLVVKHMPRDMTGKTIITNTVTEKDVEDFRARGVSTLITTTPDLGGRSFGTNVMEGLIVCLLEKRPQDVTEADIDGMLDRLDLKPRIEVLNPPSIVPA